MCYVLKVSRSGYYRWMRTQRSKASTRKIYLLMKIKEVHEQSNKIYGSRRIYHELKSQGIKCYRNQIEGGLVL